MAGNKGTLKASDVAASGKQLAQDEIFDVSVGKLVFESIKKGLSTGVGDVMTEANVEETMQGATGMTIDMLDRDYEALNSGLFGTRVVCTVDGVSFRLTEVSLVEQFRLKALFEHRLVAEMREHSNPLKASRGSETRAEFILTMLRELKLPYTFICPELHRRQPVARRKESKSERKEKEEERNFAQAQRQAGITPTADLKVKRATATAAQLEQASILLGVVSELGGGELCAVAIICAAIGESDLTALTTPNSLGFWGVLQGSSGKDPRWPAYWPDPSDSAGMAHAWCKGEKGFAIGGLVLAALKLPPGEIATKVEGSGEPENFYGQYEGEAKAIVKAFSNGGLGSFTAGGASALGGKTVKTATYEYERGQPGQAEDTFTCALRLAAEVGWSFFVCGRKSIYFVNDDDLLKARARYKITPTSKGLVDIKFDAEVGNRTIVIHGKRQPKPSTAELEVRIDRWLAPPGTVIALNGFGPADGPWLVERIERTLYSALAIVHLRAPQKPLEEPAPSLTAATGGTEPSGVPTGTPAPAAGAYREPAAQGPKGTGTFQGVTVASWIIPELEYAKAHGWTGSIISGYRPGPDPHTASGGSEHQGTQYPHGAVDFGGYGAYSERAAFFAHTDGYKGLPLIPAQFPGDGGHASGTGH